MLNHQLRRSRSEKCEVAKPSVAPLGAYWPVGVKRRIIAAGIVGVAALCSCSADAERAAVPKGPGDPGVYQQLSTETDCTMLEGSKMFFESLVGSDSAADGYIEYAETRLDEVDC